MTACPQVERGPGVALERMNIVVAGHVDHGKSTIVGRLLADTGSLPEGKLEQVRELCARTARPFEYAFLLDALKDEQAQGITIDSARVFFSSERRQYVIIDAPGHVEFLKNMISGAARAEAAFLVIDAKEGIRENSRRHGYLMALLGIRQVAILVNKMDLVGYDRAVYDRIVAEYLAFLAQIGLEPAAFVPVSGANGDNLVGASLRMPWYHGPSALEVLDGFQPAAPDADRPFRMPVQAVLKFTERGDDRRIVSGTVETGTLRVGDEVVFHPSGKRSRVRTIEGFNQPAQTAVAAGESAGFTLDEQVYVARGELATVAGQAPPRVGRRIGVSLFWLGKRPLVRGRDYILKLGTARVPARLEEIHRVIDASALEIAEGKRQVDRHEVADCVLVLRTPLAFDLVGDFAATSRFVLVDGYDISGGGIVREVQGTDGRAARLVILQEVEGAAGVPPDEVAPWIASEEGAPVYRLSARHGIGRLAAVAETLLEPGVTVLLSIPAEARAEVEPITASLAQRDVEVRWVGAG